MQKNRWIKDDLRFKNYISILQKHGLEIHPSVKPAIFALNNGLQYPGLRVSEPIVGEAILVKLPTTLLLTSHKARQQPALKDVFLHQFYHTGQLWQDRILITYLLYINEQKDQNNVWFHMVNLLAKDIDILSFWQTEQINKFKDETLPRAALLERHNFQNQWKQFQLVKQDNWSFFQKFNAQTFSKENYQWIYTHTVSRCFGSFMNSTYFTPFCQFFNHHCVGVSYQCVTQAQYQQYCQKKQNHPEIGENQVENAEKEEVSSASSISSGDSIEFIEDGDFNYWQVESYKIKWNSKICFDLRQTEIDQINKLHAQCLDTVEKLLIWSGFNFAFLGQIIEKVHILKSEFLAGRKKFITVKEGLLNSKSLIQNYRSQASKFYRLMGFRYDPRVQSNQTLDDLNANTSVSNHLATASLYTKSSSPPSKAYKYFLMQSGSDASFQTLQQIYFCYGRISNRAMLILYGCCIEDNLHEHVWMKLDLGKILSPYPDLFDKIQEKGLPIKFKFKLRPTVWAYELYLWLKIQKWELAKHSIHQIFLPHDIDQEIQIFETICFLVEQKINDFSTYQNFQDLNDPKASYHEYFTRVYHSEKVKILKKHASMARYIIQNNKRMKKLKKILKHQDSNQPFFQKQLKGYWKILEKGIICF